MIRHKYGRGMGWLPDLPDHRDLTPDHESVKKVTEIVPAQVGIESELAIGETRQPVGITSTGKGMLRP